MIIQKLLFPREGVCTDWEMYFRGVEQREVKSKDGKMYFLLKKGECLSLETYFNSFSIGKWTTYTKLSNLLLELEYEGKLKVEVKHVVGNKSDEIFRARTTEEKVAMMTREEENAEFNVCENERGCKVSFDKLYKEGIVYVTLLALEDTEFYGGAYTTEESELRDVRISFNICTFKREKEVEHNVKQIINDVLENQASPLYKNAEVYVSDNGQSLPLDLFGNRDDVHIFPNKNAGGAGGFTRTIIESVLKRKGTPFTHFILMDDDIQFDSEVLERTYHILRMLKDEYKDANLCGSMLEREDRYMQFEGGAYWKGVMLKSYNHEWDLREQKAVAANEAYNELNYGGWWYCCIPTSVVNEKNLPIPMFIHYDDIEYGRRLSSNGIIMMNGICVWHPYGGNKQPISMNYYDERNILIAMSGYEEYATKAKMIDHLARIITRDVMRYKYEAAETCFMGMEAFFDGPEAFMKIDPIEKHKELGAMNYKYSDPDGYDLSKMHDREYEDYPRFIPQMELLCWLLPSFKKLRIVSEKDIGYGFFAKQIYLYDRNRKQGFLTERNFKKTLAALKRYFALRKRIKNEFDDKIAEWKEYKEKFTCLEYWEKYLDLED
ncbi:MAG: glycosyltransferase [Lachnospiraceae bacterium]|nr:glycosyltransferase [Lachnospiraceae bacterium]